MAAKLLKNTGILLLLLGMLFSKTAMAQMSESGNATLSGYVLAGDDSSQVTYAAVFLDKQYKGDYTNEKGYFHIEKVLPGTQRLHVHMNGFKDTVIELQVEAGVYYQLTILLQNKNHRLQTVTIKADANNLFGVENLSGVKGMAIYEGKKNEIIELKNINANLATNNSRQVFAKVPGINIIENDGAGIQLGIGARGLNPHRITEFNSRQNGYDISADALGYPESYYTPPTEALERIEVVRGAASLQYGSQFGGLLNFVFKQGPADKVLEVNTRQTIGSYGLLNSFNSVGGAKGKWNYYGFIHHKQGNGWRNNAGFNINTAYASARYKANRKLSIGTELTYMHYGMQQPGGLTDAQFEDDPRQATRSRNWFSAQWMIPAVTIDYTIDSSMRINVRNFALVAYRNSLGNLISPNQPDYRPSRTLMVDNYLNIGSEARFLKEYKVRGNKAAFLTGLRYYRGNTHRQQGLGSNGDDADFSFVNPDDLENSDFRFPSTNMAVFAENIFPLSKKLTFTPGVRYEYIETNSTGYYKIEFDKLNEQRQNARSFPLLGAGLSYHINNDHNLYLNFSQAYSGVNFNDMRVLSPTLKVDPKLKDVTGYNCDLGIRGKHRNFFSYDVSAFLLSYNDRIGVLTKADENFNVYRYRTNIADSRSMGVEAFGELNLFKLVKLFRAGDLSVFSSASFVDARYINTPTKAILNKKVEYAPSWTSRSGLTYKLKGFGATFQYGWVSKQYTDATNTEFTLNAVNGVIPAYTVCDLSLSYNFKRYQVSASVNNLANKMYFTRRADGYPGPGILPSDGRTFYLTLGATL